MSLSTHLEQAHVASVGEIKESFQVLLPSQTSLSTHLKQAHVASIGADILFENRASFLQYGMYVCAC